FKAVLRRHPVPGAAKLSSPAGFLLRPRPAAAAGTRLRVAAVALTACLALSTGAALDATADLHHTVEAAQQGPAARP
ncbi:hypothetical protein ABZW03_40450, partial [Kitasatospora sp. NPDC004799]